MKFTVDRTENGFAVCEFITENNEVGYKEFPVSDIPFEVTEGVIFTATESNGTWTFTKSEDDLTEANERKKRVRNKLDMLFGKK